MVMLLSSQTGRLRYFATMVILAELKTSAIVAGGTGGLQAGWWWCWFLASGGSRAMGRWVRRGQLFGRLGNHGGQEGSRSVNPLHFP